MSESDDRPTGSAQGAVSRRGFLGGAGGLAASGLAVGGIAGAAGGFAAGYGTPAPAAASAAEVAHPFYGSGHQAGIRTEPQRYTVFMSYDLTTSVARDVEVLLARWSAAIAQLAKGLTVGSVEPHRPDAVGVDSGEALDLGPEGLTVTIGFGPGLFDERYGLAARRPRHLAELPAMPSDQLQPALTGGDLSLQACADDPQVAYHAIRTLTRMAKGTATTRWTVTGFGRASAGPTQQTPRNLMGFKDGTRNIVDDADYERWVWAGSDDQPWMTGGSYLVARKIHIATETWDTDRISDQNAVVGRTKVEGAPLTGSREHDVPDFEARDASGQPVIPATSHVALAAHENNGGVKILRRGYNYTEGIDALGQIDAGLLFLAYMRDPQQFITLQTKLGRVDRLNEYIAHIGSAVFAVPPAARQGSYIGAELFRS
ncbi:iron uptake transporter deferrochelatase/peroxidase subunit [Galbitalea soli]|uniref:Deferrochelatase n=1 Tax=Galbitalea soli TaxID=1268042 RepID=A0A7C9TP96_9MICO|nr:deferrochelatase/peroxidase EfeB [Galbitalea soli]NYJ31335.1 deferrochelatase/peroxidase EfeB [Galbitalea soli]